MKIKYYKKKLVILSIVLIIIGATISTVGFGMAGFDMNQLKDGSQNVWYQTLHFGDKGLWYGIDIGNNIHPFTIGISE